MRMVSWLWKGSNGDDENQEDLKKKGFDPQNLDVGVAMEETITDFSKDYDGFISPSLQEIKGMVLSYKQSCDDSGFFPTKKNLDISLHIPKEVETAETKLKLPK